MSCISPFALLTSTWLSHLHLNKITDEETGNRDSGLQVTQEIRGQIEITFPATNPEIPPK